MSQKISGCVSPWVRSLAVAGVMSAVFIAGCDAEIEATEEGDVREQDEAELRSYNYYLDADSITAGTHHTCSLNRQDTTVWCWGSNSTDVLNPQVTGKLGDGSTVLYSPVPVQVEGANGLPFNQVYQVSAGSEHTCAVTFALEVWCWGADNAGQLGNGPGDNHIPRLRPVRVTVGGQPLKNVLQVSAGRVHTCAVTTDSGAYCWGSDLEHQLGNVQQQGSSEPVAVAGVNGAGLLTGIDRISAGSLHTCASKTDGSVFCWGSNSYGMLGAGKPAAALAYSETPVQVMRGLAGTNPPPLAGVSRLDAGARHSCAVGAGGQVWCWGFNGKGALGAGEAVDHRSFAAPVLDANEAPLTGATGVSVGADFGRYSNAGAHSCATRALPNTKGEYVYCWGDNRWNSTRESRMAIDGPGSPLAVPALGVGQQRFKAARAVAAGSFHTCAIDWLGAAWCWGNNEKGQLGIGAADPNSHTRPELVVGLPDLGLWEEEDE